MATESLTSTTEAQHEACRQAIREGLAKVRIPAPISLSRWADENFYLSPESSAVEGPWETVPFQRGIMDLMSCDDVEMLDFPKCARIGYTKMLVAFAGYQLVYNKRTGAIFQPTEGDSDGFAEDEINPMIRDCDAVGQALLANPEKQGPNNKLSFKKFRGASLYLRGGHSGRSYRRLTLDWVVYDELEGFEREVGDEGGPVTLGDGRISNSAFPKSIRGSTLREAGDSLMGAEIEKAALMLRYFVHCPHCKEPQTLKWKQMRWAKEGTVDERARTAHYECEHCHETMQYADIWQLLEGGYWGTDDGLRVEITEADPILRDQDGKAVEWPRHVAMHLWIAYSPFFSWEKLVYEWLSAQGDYRALKVFTNLRLGEAWEDQVTTVEHSTLFQRRGQYLRPPSEVLVLTAGVDVQSNRIEVEVIGWSWHEQSWGVEYRVIYGDPELPEVWNDLDLVLGQTFETEDGRRLPIAAVGLDTGYLANQGYLFSKRSQHPRIFCMKGSSEQYAPLTRAPSKQRIGRSSESVDLFVVGSSVAKSIIYKRLALKEAGPGYCHFPPTYDEPYFLGLTAEKKVTKKRKGFEVVEWIKEYERNEPLDIRVYGLAALTLLNPVWSSLDPAFDQKTKVDATRGPVDAVQQAYVQQRRRNRARQQRRRGFVHRR